MGILTGIKRLFTWWDGQTLNTQLFTARKGVKVGSDGFGNIYYRNQDGSRRWVIFKGEVEPTKVSADWHGWLHHTFDDSPADRPVVHKAWEQPHEANLTGTLAAHVPVGSLRRPELARRADYDAWTPE